MKVLRTAQERFAELPGFGYEPRYADVGGLRLAYVEARPPDGEPVLLHGEPSWSFLYRKVIPVLAGAGLRAIAPDLIGFGRSDKPPAVLAAYDAPFPEPSYTAAVRAMPDLVPATPDNPASAANRAAWRQLATWDKPFLVAFSDRDAITGGMAPGLKRDVPGAAGRQHPVLEGAGHFLQEDAGEELGAIIAAFVRET
jgi:pimeloyl-ACP methyl ester carboxylesterase